MFSPYPCRCLWRGLLQMTRTTPLRFTILHFSQRTFTEALTFIPSLSLHDFLFEPVGDAAPG